MPSLRIIPEKQVYETIIDAIGKIYCQSTPETITLINNALAIEEDDVAKDMLNAMLKMKNWLLKKTSYLSGYRNRSCFCRYRKSDQNREWTSLCYCIKSS